ncbi:DUF4406 domain-containing protein [Pseudomonas cichorii]|nr:DUF4406 domain-containing protein [Pseudomonas cichorii]MBX8534584.1 DUF4406 domain-containing protein [Pseudomonas cichorii]
MSKIYLSGPMTGLPELNFPAFNAETARLRGLGFDVVNPAELNPDGASWGECMRKDIVALMGCSIVATLPGWEHSKGARLEVLIGERLEMAVVKAQDLICPPENATTHVAQLQAEVERLRAQLSEYQVDLDNLSLEQVLAICRGAAQRCDEQHSYMASASSAPHQWFPHKWVVDAIKAILCISRHHSSERNSALARSAELERLLRDCRWRIVNKDVSTEDYARLDRPVVARIDAALAEGKEQPTVEGLTDDEWQKKDEWERHDAEGKES